MTEQTRANMDFLAYVAAVMDFGVSLYKAYKSCAALYDVLTAPPPIPENSLTAMRQGTRPSFANIKFDKEIGGMLIIGPSQ